MMKKIFAISSFVAFLMMGCNSSTTNESQTLEKAESKKSVTPTNAGKVIQISTAEFKALVYDYDKHPEKWTFIGDKPCVVDFYADWCRPCKMIAPYMEELAVEYAGKVNFYKINIDQNKDLASAFQVSSIPMVVFCGLKLEPEPLVGAFTKANYKSLIEKILNQ